MVSDRANPNSSRGGLFPIRRTSRAVNQGRDGDKLYLP